MIKPAYSVSFLLSINSFVWQNVLYFLDAPRISDKNRGESQNTHFVFNNGFFFFQSRTVYELMWKNIVEPGRLQMTIWRMQHCMLDAQGYKHTLS